MINLIYGAKGTDKTKKLIDKVNDSLHSGDVVFITDSDEYNFSITHKVRLINAREYGIDNSLSLYGLVTGILASNGDIEHIYIDGAQKLCDKSAEDMKSFYERLDDLCTRVKFDITITVSCDVLPKYLEKYI